MSNKWEFFLDEFRKFIQQKNWQIISEKEIEFARQLIVTDGNVRLPVNFYTSGKILTQGKPCDLKSAITEWANLIQSGLISVPSPAPEAVRQNRISKYLVLSENREKIRQVVLALAGCRRSLFEPFRACPQPVFKGFLTRISLIYAKELAKFVKFVSCF